MKRKRRIKRTILITLLVFVITTTIVAIILTNSGKFLKRFKITSVSNISTKYHLTYEKVNAASYYEIIVYNENNEIFYAEKTKETDITIDLAKLEYDQNYQIMVLAYDDFNDSVSSKNPYNFKYTEPTFDSNNNLVLDNGADYTLFINGDLTKKDYYIGLYDNNEEILKEKLTNNDYVISKKYFDNLSKQIIVKIFDQENEINKIILYSNLSPISDIKIINPVSEVLDYEDVIFEYDGGDNATSYQLEIYKDDKFLSTKTLNNKKAVISENFFEKNNKYTLKVKALYNDYSNYTKEDMISFKISDKDTLKPAYISKNNWINTNQIELLNPNDDGTIYYTTDGTIPNEKSNKYEGSIEVTNDITLNAIIIAKGKNDSAISAFDLKKEVKKDFKVYLSPSNDDSNHNEIWTNNLTELNEITNFIEKELKTKGVKVYRNNPKENVNIWASTSINENCDLHLIINTNESSKHDLFGINVMINEKNNKTYSLANLLKKELDSIYYQDNPHKFIKYTYGSIKELGMVNNGILINLGYYDNNEDSTWMINNKELIGNTIARIILNYFDIN